jgi:hypothetical protein
MELLQTPYWSPRGILHTTVKASIRSDPPIPDWAATRVIEAWNVPNL